jgi:hypothetical protein
MGRYLLPAARQLPTVLADGRSGFHAHGLHRAG